jgi:hypothetical protein
MTLPPPPDRWTIELANAQRLEAIAAFGFTERQARFRLNVLLHSGVLVERQYCTFAGIVHGQKSTDFISGLVERRFATPIATGKLHLEPSNVETLEWLFPERNRLAEPGAGPADQRYLKVSSAYRTPRYRALYRQWLDDPTNTLWLAGSRIIADNIDRGHGQVECVELSRQYLHLSPLVDVA